MWIICVGYLLHPRVLQRWNQTFSLMDSGFLSDSLRVDDRHRPKQGDHG
jgi:hypothetical protein